MTASRLLRWTRLDREEGQILPLMAAGLIGLLLMAGVVIDSGNLFQNRQALQNAADATAIAAAFEVAQKADCTATLDPAWTSNDPCAQIAGTYAGYNCANGSNGTSGPAAYGCPDTVGASDSLRPCPVTVTANQAPPTSPGCYVYPYNGNKASVEVWLVRQTSNFFGGILGHPTSAEAARAVGTLTTGPPPAISFAALQGGKDCGVVSLQIDSGADVAVNNAVYVDSCNNSQAFNLQGKSSLSAPKIEVSGGWDASQKGGGTVYVPAGTACPLNNDKAGSGTPPPGCPDINQVPVADPFALYPPAPIPGTPGPGLPGTANTPQPYSISSGTVTLSPDTYYGGICIGSGNCGNCTGGGAGTANVTLSKGVYIMAGGGFNVCGASSVNAPNGVLIYNTADPSHPSGNGALAQVDINTTGTVHLKPMTNGSYAGLTIFQDRALTLKPNSSCNSKTGKPGDWDIALQNAASLGPTLGALGSISGTIYAPGTNAIFGNTMSGTANLALITSCIYVGASSTFNYDPGNNQLFGVSATLGE